MELQVLFHILKRPLFLMPTLQSIRQLYWCWLKFFVASFDSRLCLWCFLEHRRPWTQCRCFLKCFHVQCYEVLLQVLDLQLQCGNLPYQLVSWLPKKTSVSSDGIYYTIHVLVKTSVSLRTGLSLDRVTGAELGPNAFSSAPCTFCCWSRCLSSCTIYIRSSSSH